MSNQARCGDCIRCLTDGTCIEPLKAHSDAHDRIAAKLAEALPELSGSVERYMERVKPTGACGCVLGTVHKCADGTSAWRNQLGLSQDAVHPNARDAVLASDRMHKALARVLEELPPTTAQERFDALYISSNEIAERLHVSRQAVLHARVRGVLPDPVCVNAAQIYIWERKELEPYLAAWEASIKLRRGEQVVVQHGPGNPFHTPVSYE